ncbi:hypothetical protein EJB05_43463, partial [Eragrostis curvula]
MSACLVCIERATVSPWAAAVRAFARRNCACDGGSFLRHGRRALSRISMCEQVEQRFGRDAEAFGFYLMHYCLHRTRILAAPGVFGWKDLEPYDLLLLCSKGIFPHRSDGNDNLIKCLKN